MSVLKDALFLVLGAGWTRLTAGASILMYHSVSENGLFFTVTPQDFERQMRYLKEAGYKIVPLTDMYRRLKAKESVDGQIAITFDDGFRDNYTHAFPILKRYGFPATIFVTTDLIGKQDKRGIDRLSSNELKEMEASGIIDIEPHTKSHPHLAALSRTDAEEEIGGSKRLLEDLLKKRTGVFAYPYGSYNEDTVHVVEECGFDAAVGVREGTVRSGTDMFRLPRNSVDSTTTFTQFRGKVSDTIDRYQALKVWQ